MSTRYSKTSEIPGMISGGYEGDNIPDDIEVPSCTIEDVDRALFNLFNDDLPLFYKHKEGMRRIPVIFATGERFAILRRKRPLRDKAGALILPLISIMRTGIEQTPSRGMTGGQSSPMTIKKRISKKDPRYQMLRNKNQLKNQDNLASKNHVAGQSASGRDQFAEPGTIASRRPPNPRTTESREGKLLSPNLADHIYEVITLPPVKYYQSTYEVTFWAQYTQQMNDMLTALMVTPQNYHGKSFRIETEKGYWFVAYMDAALTSGTNFDDFTDDERLVRYSFTISVPAYIVSPEFPGSQTGVRRFLSAPEITFQMTETKAFPFLPAPANIPSPDPGSYILQDLSTIQDPLPGNAIGGSPEANTLASAGVDVPGAAISRGPLPGASLGGQAAEGYKMKSTAIGGKEASGGSGAFGGGGKGKTSTSTLRMVRDPFTGQMLNKLVRIKDAGTASQKKGETVYKEGITIDLGTLTTLDP